MGWTFACPYCEARFQASPASLGRVVRCPICEKKMELSGAGTIDRCPGDDRSAGEASQTAGPSGTWATLLPPRFTGDLPEEVVTVAEKGAALAKSPALRHPAGDFGGGARGDDFPAIAVDAVDEDKASRRMRGRRGGPQVQQQWGRRARSVAIFVTGALVLAIAAAVLMRR